MDACPEGHIHHTSSPDLQDPPFGPILIALSLAWMMYAHKLTVALECAGNGRSLLSPPTPGEQWQQVAVSTA
jgi:hypothetical protein